ncbi:uncharacterized protein LY79DRAFT_533895 [Colletotrichum navitas]|uniref:Secreted protein n=1 Tax=Colletotrichum navitas TaxID=681940 RepID=A0AAD8VAL4_9PEZI|nr:uncharacterized protein LY79DRAFT_533895 [Colletotrichum navitas]KAK1600527.1 hypothetical protein LY79DRAFT_533895 [Colletotrichum navitas]
MSFFCLFFCLLPHPTSSPRPLPLIVTSPHLTSPHLALPYLTLPTYLCRPLILTSPVTTQSASLALPGYKQDPPVQGFPFSTYSPTTSSRL